MLGAKGFDFVRKSLESKIIELPPVIGKYRFIGQYQPDIITHYTPMIRTKLL